MPGEQQENQIEQGQSAAEIEGKDLIIHLGGGSSDNILPDPKAQRLKSWANIIATAAALVTAVGALVRPQDQTVTKNAYEQLKASLEQTNKNVQSNHDDIVALHNYLQGYFASNSRIALPPISGSSGGGSSGGGSSSGSSSGSPNPSMSATINKLPAFGFAVPKATDTATIAYAPPPAPPVFPLPPISSNITTSPLPPFDSVAAKK